MKTKTNKQPRNMARLTEDDDGWHLRLYGIVGDDWDGFTDDSVADMVAGLERGAGDVRINSPGGMIYQGMAIYNQLREKQPKVIKIDGLAASMGSVIALAGQRCEIARGAMMMIHNPWNIAMGDADELRKTAEILDKFKQSIIDVYQAKTGQEREILSEMMDEAPWLTAEEAVAGGVCAAITEEEGDMASVNLSVLAATQNMPHEVRALMRAQGKPVTPAADVAVSHPHGEVAMTDKTKTPAAGNEPAKDEAVKAAEDKARQDAVAAERSRVREIKQMADAAEGVNASFGEKLIEDGLSVAEAKAAIDRLAEYLAKHKETEGMTNTHRVELTRDERDTTRNGVAKALLNRWAPQAHRIEGDDPARRWANMSLIEICRGLVEANGVKTHGMTRHEIARAAFHTTSDFPAILENVITKSLRSRYELAPRTFTVLANQATLPDYKEVSRAQLGEAPALAQVLEGGEYTYGTIGDAAEKYRLFKYGKIVAITREVIINDDLDAFTRVPAMMGAAAGQLESDLFWAHITGNPLMYDGFALFSTEHGNLAGTPAVINVANIGLARAAMRQQTGLNGVQRINVQPRYLVVPAALETVAEQFVSTNLLADAAGSINPFAGRLQVVSEPRLDANSATAWHLWADPAMTESVEYAYLQGEEGPQIETEEGFDVDGLKVKVRHDFGVKATDWRGVYRNAGA